MLSQRLGERAHIRRDDKLDGNDIVTDEIVEQFNSTALRGVHPQPARPAYGMVHARTARVLRCRRRRLQPGRPPQEPRLPGREDTCRPGTALPDAMQTRLGCELFAEDDGAPHELDPAFGDAARREFLSRISRLAWSLALTLQQLRMHGHEVLPAQPLVQSEELRVSIPVLVGDTAWFWLAPPPTHPLDGLTGGSGDVLQPFFATIKPRQQRDEHARAARQALPPAAPCPARQTSAVLRPRSAGRRHERQAGSHPLSGCGGHLGLGPVLARQLRPASQAVPRPDGPCRQRLERRHAAPRQSPHARPERARGRSRKQPRLPLVLVH